MIGCHCGGIIAVRMRKMLARAWVGVECVTCFNSFILYNLRPFSLKLCIQPGWKYNLRNLNEKWSTSPTWYCLKRRCRKTIYFESAQCRIWLVNDMEYLLVYLNGNNAADGKNNIKYTSSYPIKWTVKNWYVQDFKDHGHDADEWRDYDEDNVPF